MRGRGAQTEWSSWFVRSIKLQVGRMCILQAQLPKQAAWPAVVTYAVEVPAGLCSQGSSRHMQGTAAVQPQA
jgi:hypothetical protein